MTVSLQTAVSRERERRTPLAPILPASAYVLSGAELARYCAAAVRSYPPSRHLSDDERDALAGMLAERIYRRRMGTGRPADVLRYLSRVERFPTLYAGADSGVPRGAAGHEYLRRECASLMRDSREWRDVAATYESAARRDRDAGPMIESADTYADADALTRAAAREVERSTGEPLAALPLMSAEVAEHLGDRLAAEGAPRRAVGVALCGAAGVPLASVAVALGVSLVTVKRESAKGAAYLRGCDLVSAAPKVPKDAREKGAAYCPGCDRAPHPARVPAAALVEMFRESADALGHVLPADPDAPTLPPSGPHVRTDDPRKGARTAPLRDRRHDTASTRDLRSIAGPEAPRLTPADAPHYRDRAPFPACTAWRVTVRKYAESGHPYPALAAHAERVAKVAQ